MHQAGLIRQFHDEGRLGGDRNCSCQDRKGSESPSVSHNLSSSWILYLPGGDLFRNYRDNEGSNNITVLSNKAC